VREVSLKAHGFTAPEKVNSPYLELLDRHYLLYTSRLRQTEAVRLDSKYNMLDRPCLPILLPTLTVGVTFQSIGSNARFGHIGASNRLFGNTLEKEYKLDSRRA
jgi:hypothetical protein